MYYKLKFSYEKFDENNVPEAVKEHENTFSAELIGKDVVFTTAIKSDSLVNAFKSLSSRAEDNTENRFDMAHNEVLRAHETELKNTFSKLMEKFRKAKKSAD